MTPLIVSLKSTHSKKVASRASKNLQSQHISNPKSIYANTKAPWLRYIKPLLAPQRRSSLTTHSTQYSHDGQSDSDHEFSLMWILRVVSFLEALRSASYFVRFAVFTAETRKLTRFLDRLETHKLTTNSHSDSTHDPNHFVTSWYGNVIETTEPFLLFSLLWKNLEAYCFHYILTVL